MIAALLLVCAALAAGEPIQSLDGVRFPDPSRPGHQVEALVFYQDGGRPCPLVVFSHDLGRSRAAYWWLGEAWARAGYAVVFPTHAGSDRALIDGRRPLAARDALLAAAADPQVWRSRPADLLAVLDHLDRLEDQVAALRGRLLRGSIGVAGHSLGACTAQMLAGVEPLIDGRRLGLWREPVVACVALSPFGLEAGFDAEALSKSKVPTLLVAGGRDDQPAGRDTTAHEPAWREQGFGLLPAGTAWLIRIPDAHHFTFSNGGWGPRVDARHAALVAERTTAFWDRFLRQREEADPLALPPGLASGERR